MFNSEATFSSLHEEIVFLNLLHRYFPVSPVDVQFSSGLDDTFDLHKHIHRNESQSSLNLQRP